jgi:glycosyltransferase involved in cell wall biosynthesis
MKHNQMHVALLGESGFPFGMAAIEKVRLLGKGMNQAGAEVSVVNHKGRFDPAKPVDLPVEGRYEGIHYIYTSGSVYRPTGLLARNLQKIRGIRGEIAFLRNRKREGKLDSSIVSTMGILKMLYYRIISRLIGFQLILLYVELSSAVSHRRTFWLRVNDLLFDKFAFGLSDGVLPISEMLVEIVKKTSPGKPWLKVPILTEFEKFEADRDPGTEPYLLYCGSAAYSEVIIFILRAYELVKAQDETFLYLVMGGTDAEKAVVMEEVEKMGQKERVKIFSNLPYSELVRLYINACGLLIPLRPTLQDEARFPHKIGEYLASRNPIVTQNIGEVKYYFRDQETGFIADAYEIPAYAKKMTQVLNDPEKAREIGQKGYEMGLKHFDYKYHGREILRFMMSVAGNQNKRKRN